jgi:SAM-dependent methyltransferase
MNETATGAHTPSAIAQGAAAYYSARVREHGPTPQGADWNSADSQIRRFAHLMQLVDRKDSFAVLDYGCGYGALLDYLRDKGCGCAYTGFDLSAAMLMHAREAHAPDQRVCWTNDRHALCPADYVVASGLFNVKQETPHAAWHAYALDVLAHIDALAVRGFAFNMLTAHADAEYMRADLFYADPGEVFNYCVRTFSRQVTLIHGQGLYEFTVLVHKDPGDES